jgi:hypothetical protein
MANEFIIKNGFRSQGNSEVTGSLNITGGITGSFSGSISAPGSDTQVVYNNGGVLGANSGFVYDGGGRINLEASAGPSYATFQRTGGGVAIVGADSDTNAYFQSDNNIKFLTGLGSTKMFISSSGNIGIGTSTPTSTLHSVGSFLNELTPTSLKIQSDLSSSFGLGSTYIAGLGWTPLVISGSTTSFRADGNRFKLNGITQGNLGIPALGASFPLEANIQLFATGSDYVSIGTQFTDLSGIGGNSTLNSNQNGVFSGSYGNNSYTISINKTYGSNESSLNLQKVNNSGETIALNLNSGNDGFSIFSTLSQPTSSFLKFVSGSSNNLIDFRYDANYIQRSTIIGSDTSTSPSARLQVKGAGATSATETLRITDSNNTSLFKIFDNGGVSQGSSTTPSGNNSHSEGASNSAYGAFAHSEGLFTIASASYSHAEGFQTQTIGQGSHAEGQGGQAIGDYSHAEGLGTLSSGSYSHAEGNTTFADGYASHAEGDNTQAQGDFSHAEGAYTITTDAYQHAQGQYNLAVSGAGAFILGNGIDDSNRSNLIFASGSTVQITGSLDVTSTSSASALLRISSPASSSILFVSGSGNVGINTNAPGTRFTVNGDMRLVTPNNSGLLAYDDPTAGSFIWSVTRGTISNANDINILARNGFAVRTGTTTPTTTGHQFYISNSGSVGIGTITPSASLHISGASSAALLRVDSPASSSILFVSGSGRIGMGTSSPTASLHIVDAGNNSTNSLQINNLFRFRGDGVMVWGQSMAQGILNWDTGKVFLGGSSGNNLELYAGGSAKMFVSSSGLVGIGTTTPLVALDARGTAIFNNASGVSYNENIRLPEATTGYASIALGGPITASGTSATQWTILKYPAASSNTFAIRNNTTDYLSITTAGNVGIGSSFITPTARLQVRGSGATSATTTFLLQNSSPINLMTVLDNGQTTFSSPLISLATSQSAFTISQSISASNVVGGQYYGVNITPTFFATTASQTETALRVAATFTGSAAAVGGQNIIADFGATSAGSQFTVTDVTSGSIYMVNDVSGLPIIEATSDWTVNMYNYPNLVFNKTGSQVNIFGTLRVSGSFILPLSQSATPQTGSAYWSGSLLFVYDGTRYRSSSFA